MKTTIVGVAGGSGSGKTTVARRLAQCLDRSSVSVMDMDAYYRHMVHLSLEERRRVNWDHPDAFDMDLLVAQLGAVAAGQPIRKPVYDFVAHLRSDQTVLVQPADVVVIDGILLFVDQRVRELCDVKVYVDTDADIRLVRRIRRDMRLRGRPLEEILEQYLQTVRPMHLEFVEPSKRYADVIIPRGGHNTDAMDMLMSSIRQRLVNDR